MRIVIAAVLALSAFSASAAEVRVFAAVSLTEALEEIAARYETTSKDTVVFHFGASSLLARQIEQGAPADLFLSADEARMDALARRGLIVASTRTSVLTNTLAVVVPIAGGMTMTRPAHLARARTIALAEPSSVPAGIYARQWMQKAGLWAGLAGRIVPTENVRAALAAVEAGNADAAIVYSTDARMARHSRVAYAIPRTEGPRISYPFALLREADNRPAAMRFLQHLRSRAALQIFSKHGFLIQ